MMDLTNKLPRVFYGWWIVGACFLISLFSGGAVILGFTAFFEPIADEFGWSYAQISLAVSLRGSNVALLAPLLGFLVDRWGPRRLIFGGTIILGLALIILSYVNSLAMFYGAFILVAIGISSTSPTVMTAPVSNWFRRKLGMAAGIMACGFALGGLLVPVITTLIDVYDWRTAIVILGVSIWVIGLPLSLLVRHKPEQYGYLPDGEQNNSVIPQELTIPEKTDEVNIGVKKALKSSIFWRISLAFTFIFLPISTMTVHVMPYLNSIGIARSTSSFIASALPLVSIVGRIGAGLLSDRFNKVRVASGFFIILSLGILCFSYVSKENIWLIVISVIFFGTGWGSNFPLRVALIRGYFGRSNFGTIFGFIMGITAIGSIIGPFFAGWAFDNWGSYRTVWLIFTGLIFVASIIMATMPPVDTRVRQGNSK